MMALRGFGGGGSGRTGTAGSSSCQSLVSSRGGESTDRTSSPFPPSTAFMSRSSGGGSSTATSAYGGGDGFFSPKGSAISPFFFGGGGGGGGGDADCSKLFPSSALPPLRPYDPYSGSRAPRPQSGPKPPKNYGLESHPYFINGRIDLGARNKLGVDREKLKDDLAETNSMADSGGGILPGGILADRRGYASFRRGFGLEGERIRSETNSSIWAPQNNNAEMHASHSMPLMMNKPPINTPTARTYEGEAHLLSEVEKARENLNKSLVSVRKGLDDRISAYTRPSPSWDRTGICGSGHVNTQEELSKDELAQLSRTKAEAYRADLERQVGEKRRREEAEAAWRAQKTHPLGPEYDKPIRSEEKSPGNGGGAPHPFYPPPPGSPRPGGGGPSPRHVPNERLTQARVNLESARSPEQWRKMMGGAGDPQGGGGYPSHFIPPYRQNPPFPPYPPMPMGMPPPGSYGYPGSGYPPPPQQMGYPPHPPQQQQQGYPPFDYQGQTHPSSSPSPRTPYPPFGDGDNEDIDALRSPRPRRDDDDEDPFSSPRKSPRSGGGRFNEEERFIMEKVSALQRQLKEEEASFSPRSKQEFSITPSVATLPFLASSSTNTQCPSLADVEKMKGFVEEQLRREDVDYDELRAMVLGRPNHWKTTSGSMAEELKPIKDMINRADLAAQIKMNAKKKRIQELKDKAADAKLELKIREYYAAQKRREMEADAEKSSWARIRSMNKATVSQTFLSDQMTGSQNHKRRDYGHHSEREYYQPSPSPRPLPTPKITSCPPPPLRSSRRQVGFLDTKAEKISAYMDEMPKKLEKPLVERIKEGEDAHLQTILPPLPETGRRDPSPPVPALRGKPKSDERTLRNKLREERHHHHNLAPRPSAMEPLPFTVDMRKKESKFKSIIDCLPPPPLTKFEASLKEKLQDFRNQQQLLKDNQK